MKILSALLVLFALSACVEAGTISDGRRTSYEEPADYCQKNPTKCLNGVSW